MRSGGLEVMVIDLPLSELLSKRRNNTINLPALAAVTVPFAVTKERSI